MIPDRRIIGPLVAATLCGAALMTVGRAQAFRTADELPALESDVPVTWPPVGTIMFDLAGELPGAIDEATLDRAFTAGLAAWSEINCAGPTVFLTAQHRDEHVASDRVNTIGFVAASEMPGGTSSDTPAITELQYERDGDGIWRIVEADIYLNAERSWLAEDETLSVDLATALAHELGHVVGLLHPCEPEGAGGAPECESVHEASLMFPYYYEAGAALSDDDELGYCYLYPEPKCLPGSRGCSPRNELDECLLYGCSDAGTTDASTDDAQDDGTVDASACDPTDASADAGPSCSPLLEFASECSTGEDCASGLCIGERGSAATCTRMCGADDGACPGGFECETVGGRAVCLGKQDEGLCSVAAEPGASPRAVQSHGRLLLLILAFAVGALMRRRRAGSKSFQMPS